MVATIGRPLGKARVGEPYGEAAQPRGHEDIRMSAWPEDIGDMGMSAMSAVAYDVYKTVTTEPQNGSYLILYPTG
jgi:hypothetical protein